MSNVPGKYMLTIRYGGYNHIRPIGEITSDEEALRFRDHVQKQQDANYNSKKGRSKGARPFVYIWKRVE